jgi:hypothetical protein
MSEEMTSEAQAPVEQAVVSEAPAENTVEQAAPQEVAENKGQQRLQARFSELTAKIRAAEEEREYWRQLATRAPEPEPSPEDYADPYSPEAIQAVVQRTLQTERQNMAAHEAQKAQAERNEAVRTKLFESGLEGAVLIATGANIPFTPAMIDAVAVSDNGAHIADHLGRNPQEAARIAQMPPHLQGYELAKLESRLASQPRLTAAPPPPSTVGARAAASHDPAGMSMEQYIAARNAGQI